MSGKNMNYNASYRKRWKRRLYDEQHGKCILCGCDMDLDVDPTGPCYPTFEHIVPRSEGGKGAIHNVKLSHRVCNEARGNAAIN